MTTSTTTIAGPALPLRVHDLKQWAYCARIVFYNYVMPVDRKSTYKMQHGGLAEEAIDRLEKRRKLTEFGLAEGRRQFHVWCNSHRLGLSGKLDLLIDSAAGLFPVDFKASERSVHDNHITQLCGYALLLEDKFQRPVERGFVFLIPNEEIVPVELTSERKERTRQLLAEMRLAIAREAMPAPTEVRARCENCEYRNYCADIFQYSVKVDLEGGCAAVPLSAAKGLPRATGGTPVQLLAPTLLTNVDGAAAAPAALANWRQIG